MKQKSVLIFLILNTILVHFSIASFSFKKIYSFFIPETAEEIVQKEYPLDAQGVLEIENINGTIHIKSEWNQNSIFLKAIKKAPTTQQLQNLSIINAQSTPKRVKIKTTYGQDNNKGSIDYFLLVPAKTDLQLQAHNGNIKIKQAHGPIKAITTDGNIEINNAHDTVLATVTHTGVITVDQALGNIKATTNNGNITLHDTKNSVLATTKNGRISVQCKEVPATSKIILNASSHINLYLPQDINADLQAQTLRGTFTSDHYITLKPQTIQLNNQAWSRFKREVDGILGTGEAQIILNSQSGNIKLLKTVVS